MLSDEEIVHFADVVAGRVAGPAMDTVTMLAFARLIERATIEACAKVCNERARVWSQKHPRNVRDGGEAYDGGYITALHGAAQALRSLLPPATAGRREGGG